MATRRKKLNVLGLTCGIGSMLIGAREHGFNVVGNIEWRKYYHLKDSEGNNTFKQNFKKSFFVHSTDELSQDELELCTGIDLAMGHPECGNFSQLNQTNRSRVHDPADIPLFVDMVAMFKPRFFVMDDLPKSFIAFGMEKYHEKLSDYDLFPEWISNYHYGNIQKNRRRMFMIGALKKERWAFQPGEFHHETTVEDTIGDLYRKENSVPNHDRHVLKDEAAKGQHLKHRDQRATWKEVADYFKKFNGGHVITYHASDGTIKTRPGTYKGHWDGHAHVMDGGSPAIHAKTCLPYSIRERARIQGFPDSFVFYGTKRDRYGRWNHDKNIFMVKQTGKAMPVQFNSYIAEQVASHIQGKKFRKATGERLIEPNPYVNSAKRWYCDNVGYSNQEGACLNCWMYQTCDLQACTRPVPIDTFKGDEHGE